MLDKLETFLISDIREIRRWRHYFRNAAAAICLKWLKRRAGAWCRGLRTKCESI